MQVDIFSQARPRNVYQFPAIMITSLRDELIYKVIAESATPNGIIGIYPDNEDHTVEFEIGSFTITCGESSQYVHTIKNENFLAILERTHWQTLDELKESVIKWTSTNPIELLGDDNG